MFDNLPILLIESEGDAAQSAKDMLSSLGVQNQVVHFSSQEDGLAFLNDSATPRPCLVLLNPDASECSDPAFLPAVKSSSTLCPIPVIILTDCDHRPMVLDCYGQGAVGYLVKSKSQKRTLDKLEALVKYWSLNRLPS